MAQDRMRVLTTRLPADLVEKIDAYVAQARKRPGEVSISRSEAIRLLLREVLESVIMANPDFPTQSLTRSARDLEMIAVQLLTKEYPHESEQARSVRKARLQAISDQLRLLADELRRLDVDDAIGDRPFFRTSAAQFERSSAPSIRTGRRRTKRKE